MKFEMKKLRENSGRIGGSVLIFFSLLSTVGVQGQEARIVSRPLTPQNITVYGLPADLQTSGGLFNVGLGAPVYLEVQVPLGTTVTGVAWTLASKPAGSSTLLQASPLGANVPIYRQGDRLAFQVPDPGGRIMLVPDVVGPYSVQVTVSTDAGDILLDRIVTGSTYIGVGQLALEFHDPPQCARCHADKAASWMGTAHATAMTRKIDGIDVNFFGQQCLKCHNVGYDTTPAADNGGFDDIARMLEWMVPSPLQEGNWDAMPDELKTVSNVQCENCHGPGSQHSRTGGNPLHITVNTSSGDCGQCHEAEPYHTKNSQWNLSRHAATTRYPTGENRSACVGCHSGVGFIDRIDGLPEEQRRTDYEAITCSTCHDPHDATNPHQLRKVDGVTLMNGVQVTEGGNGRICMNCHISRRNGPEYATSYHSHFGPHNGPQTDMLKGSNAIEYGRVIPSSAHLFAVQDTCVTCHMQELDGSHPAKNLAGEHTFKPVWDANTPEDRSDDLHLTQACTQCHGPISSFDFPRQDFDLDGEIEGVQTEVKGLMERLAKLLPPYGDPDFSVNSSFTQAELQAAYNYLFVESDGSHGIHNTSYTVNILKASIADLTGDGSILGDTDNDCLPDDWELTYFGSLTAQNAEGDADNDGLSNALELAVGTHPANADTDGDGFPDFDELHTGTSPTDAADNPEVGRSSIHYAAEMLFFTEAGKTYQIQSTSDLGTQGWANVGDPIAGNGQMIQQFISTRMTERNFYRVVEAPAP